MGRSFRSLGEFGSFLMARSIEAPIAGRIGVKACAENGAEHARKLFGNEERLPPELAESTQKERARLGFTPDETLLRSGKLRSEIAVSSDGVSAGYGSEDPVQLYQELGTARIPGRHLMAISANDAREENMAIASAAGAVMAGVAPRDAIVELRSGFEGGASITQRLNELDSKTR